MRQSTVNSLMRRIKRDVCVNEFFLEQRFDLHIGMIKKIAKAGRNPPPLVALLKVILTYPWIIKTAEAKFNKKKALKIFLTHAVDQMVEMRDMDI